MSLKSPFYQKCNTPTIETHFSSSCIDKPIQEHKSISYIPRNSALKPSQICPPSSKLVSHLQIPSEPSRCSRATPGRLSQRSPSKHLKSNGLANAIKSNDLKSLRSLLKYGVNPNEIDSANVPVLLLTIEKSGKPEMLKALLENKADPNARQPLTLRTGLHLAAKHGYQSIARQLLSANASINLVDSKGESALMSAVRSDHASMVKLLIQHGANIDIKNSYNETALHLAVEKKNSDLIKVFISDSSEVLNYPNNNGTTPLLLACKFTLNDIAETIINKLEDFSTIECKEKESGKTALHWAVCHEATSLIEQLLYVGADPNSRDINSETPYLTSVKNRLPEYILETFLTYDANVLVSDRFDKTPLHYAASNSQIELLYRLVDQGADLNGRCDQGMTPLMISAFKNHPICTNTLLSLGSQHNIFDIDHATPLIHAILGGTRGSKCRSNNTETILHLIRFGSDLNEPANLFNIVKKNNIQLACDVSSLAEVRLYSPLEIAYLTGNSAVFEILIQAGGSLKSFMLEYLELNELYEENCLKFENMIEIWRYKKAQPRSLSELCRKPCLLYDYKLSKSNKNKKLIEEIIGKIKKPIIYTSIYRNNQNFLYSSCRKKNSSHIKSPGKLQRSLSYKRDKAPVLKSSQYKCSISDSSSSYDKCEFPSPPCNNKGTLMRSKSNQCTPIKDDINNTSKKRNIFNRLSLPVKPKTKVDIQDRLNKDNLTKNKKPIEITLDRLCKELNRSITFNKPQKITHQNFLIR